ncbi:HEPN domain-containing protein [Viscerimonas tarda]
MTISDDERIAIVEHRLRRAKDTLEEAKDLISLRHWHGAANRLYYACYYAVIGLLIQNKHSPHTHNGTFSLLGKYFVTTGIISKEYNKLYRNLFDLRQNGDYSDWILIDEEDIAPLLEPAKQFIETIEKLICEKEIQYGREANKS